MPSVSEVTTLALNGIAMAKLENLPDIKRQCDHVFSSAGEKRSYMPKLKTVTELLPVLLFLWCLCVVAQNTTPDQTQPDNTKINQRDKNQAEPTAEQQKENSSDRQLAAQIRRAIVKDKSLSTDAHNVKVIVQNGAVTLKGPVKSDDEKRSIEAKAAQVVGGSDKITDQIEVAPK